MEKTLNFIKDEFANQIAFASIVTIDDIKESCIQRGVDADFINAHIDTLLKLESLSIRNDTSKRSFIEGCADCMHSWYKQSKGERDPFYAEIKHDYFDDYNQCWTIDAWRTLDDDEEGVAPIEVYLDGSLKIRDGKAFYSAILDFGIIQAIEETIKEIQSENKGK